MEDSKDLTSLTASDSARNFAAIAARAADEKKGESIACYDVSDVMGISDVFVVVSASNDRQVGSIVEEVEDQLTAAGLEPLRREGHRENRWVLLDYGQFIVHVQRAQEREFYGLDRLYADTPLITIEGVDSFTRSSDFSDDVNTRTVGSIDEIPLASDGPVEDDDEY